MCQRRSWKLPVVTSERLWVYGTTARLSGTLPDSEPLSFSTRHVHEPRSCPRWQPKSQRSWNEETPSVPRSPVQEHTRLTLRTASFQELLTLAAWPTTCSASRNPARPLPNGRLQFATDHFHLAAHLPPVTLSLPSGWQACN